MNWWCGIFASRIRSARQGRSNPGKMNFVRQSALAVVACALLYVCGYLVAVQRFEIYSGSCPINDPTWSTKADCTVDYRFLGASFWGPAHALDLRVRPDLRRDPCQVQAIHFVYDCLHDLAQLPTPAVFLPLLSVIQRFSPGHIHRNPESSTGVPLSEDTGSSRGMGHVCGSI